MTIPMAVVEYVLRLCVPLHIVCTHSSRQNSICQLSLLTSGADRRDAKAIGKSSAVYACLGLVGPTHPCSWTEQLAVQAGTGRGSTPLIFVA